MKSEILSQFSMPWLTCLALIIFFSIFCGVVIWISRKSSQTIYLKMSSLPLQEDEHV